MTHTLRAGRPALVLAAFFWAALTCHSSGLKWQPDYGSALKEAAKTGRPILLVVGTDACHWCKQLDARSLSEEGVATLLNARYVLYKVDAEKEAGLAAALKVQVYPSMYFSSSSGSIVSYQEGFLEADKLKARLVAVLASVGTPDWMQRDFEMAGEAVKAGSPSRALTLLRTIVEDGKSRPVQVKAREILAKLEKDARAEADKAAAMATGGKTAEAIVALKGLETSYPGTPAAREGKQLLIKLMSRTAEAERERSEQAKELLDAARRDLKARQFLACLEKCDQLAGSHAGSEEADEAEKLAREIKGNVEWMRGMMGQLEERQASLLLAMAEAHARKGEPQEAARHLERLVTLYPSSRHAESAKSRLARLKGGPAE